MIISGLRVMNPYFLHQFQCLVLRHGSGHYINHLRGSATEKINQLFTAFFKINLVLIFYLLFIILFQILNQLHNICLQLLRIVNHLGNHLPVDGLSRSNQSVTFLRLSFKTRFFLGIVFQCMIITLYAMLQTGAKGISHTVFFDLQTVNGVIDLFRQLFTEVHGAAPVKFSPVEFFCFFQLPADRFFLFKRHLIGMANSQLLCLPEPLHEILLMESDNLLIDFLNRLRKYSSITIMQHIIADTEECGSGAFLHLSHQSFYFFHRPNDRLRNRSHLVLFLRGSIFTLAGVQFPAQTVSLFIEVTVQEFVFNLSQHC